MPAVVFLLFCFWQVMLLARKRPEVFPHPGPLALVCYVPQNSALCAEMGKALLVRRKT